MAYRRRQGITRASTFKEEIHNQTTDDSMPPSSSVLKSSYSFTPSSNSNLADQAIQALHDSDHHRSKSFDAYEDASRSKSGFWGVLARKAKAILEDDVASHYYDMPPPTRSIASQPQFQQPSQSSSDNARKMDNHTLRKGLDALTTSLNHLGDTFDKAFGRSQVAMATAAKANLLLRELKTVKADLAFAKERCTQLEEENKILRENRDKGVNRADDDLIRLQLETLLAEKARLAHENSVYALENRFLREIVEYHQLTIEDVVYLDEGNEEVTEVYPLSSSTGVPSMLSVLSSSTSTSPPSLSEDYALPSKEISPNESHDDQTLKSNQFPSPNKETESKSPSPASSA